MVSREETVQGQVNLTSVTVLGRAPVGHMAEVKGGHPMALAEGTVAATVHQQWSDVAKVLAPAVAAPTVPIHKTV